MRRAILPVLLSTLFVVGSACSTPGDSPAVRSDDASIEPISPEMPTAVRTSGAAVTPLRRLETARITLDSPDWLTIEAGDLWVKLDNGTIVRIDPGVGKVVTKVEAAGSGQFSGCQGFGSSPGSIWSCSPWGPLQRVDSASNRTESRLEIEMSASQGNLVVADEQVWFLAPDGTSLSSVNLATDEVGAPVDLGHACSDLAADDPVVWAVCPWDNQVLAVDVTTGEVTRAIELDEPRHAAVGADLWVGFAGGVAQLDLHDLSVVAVYDIRPGSSSSITIGTDLVWIRSDGGPFLVGIDPIAHEVSAVVTARDLPSGGNSVEIGGLIWATAFDDGSLVELEAPSR
jgi:hypothetical protein